MDRRRDDSDGNVHVHVHHDYVLVHVLHYVHRLQMQYELDIRKSLC